MSSTGVFFSLEKSTPSRTFSMTHLKRCAPAGQITVDFANEKVDRHGPPNERGSSPKLKFYGFPLFIRNH